MPLPLNRMKQIRNEYKGIYFMLLAALWFSIMGGCAKMLKGSFNAPQLVFYRNLIGIIPLGFSLWRRPAINKGGRAGLLVFRGVMGTLALYTLLFSIIHMPLGTAMTYNTINTFYIALLSGWLLQESLNEKIWICIFLGFSGVLLIYRPSGEVTWHYHLVGLMHGLFSALAYMSIRRLNELYDTRTIVLSFLSSGLILPGLLMMARMIFSLPADEYFFPELRFPLGPEWIYMIGMGVAALAGQYFVTKAYSNEKAGVIAAIGYSNIVFSMMIGLVLGDHWPDLVSATGTLLIIVSGIGISLFRK
jgi:drug/metabolite transporter (DMT)-like permease